MLLLINELWSQIFITLSLRLKLIIIICGPGACKVYMFNVIFNTCNRYFSVDS
jgi:tryptophan-rich sensory protein